MDQTTTIRPADAPAETPPPRPAVIAIRKSCDAEGTGLSHFVLMDKEALK